MSRPYQGVMFDLDGTLVDTLDAITAAANHALEKLGRPAIERDRYRYLAGQGLRSLITEALGSDGQPQVPDGMALFRAYYAEHGNTMTRPYPGIEDLLDRLRQRDLKLAVLSNKPDRETQRCVAEVLAGHTFDAVRGHQPGAELKPDPVAAQSIVGELGTVPDQWLYVGDTRVDMLTANRVGMYPVGVLWGFREEAELREAGARTLIREPSALLELLDAPA